MDLHEQWQVYEQTAAEAGHSVSREHWLVGNVPVYVADSMEEAVEDVVEGAMTDLRQYSFHSGGKPTFEAYPGQPAEEITFDQVAKQRNWIIGDPDHCVRRIKELEEVSGGFGGLLIVTLEWTSREKWYRSLELFARYVMPQFQGSLRGVQDSFSRMAEDNRLGRLPAARSASVPVDGGRAGR